MKNTSIIAPDIQKAPRTGDWKYETPLVDKEKCIGCGQCVAYCPEATILLKKYQEGQKDKADIDYDFCKGCGVCAQVCPVKSILMKKD